MDVVYFLLSFLIPTIILFVVRSGKLFFCLLLLAIIACSLIPRSILMPYSGLLGYITLWVLIIFFCSFSARHKTVSTPFGQDRVNIGIFKGYESVSSGFIICMRYLVKVKILKRYFPGDHSNSIYKQFLLLRDDFINVPPFSFYTKGAFDILNTHLKNYLSLPSTEPEYENMINEKHYTHLVLAYLAIIDCCNDVLYTGTYHSYRGQLSSTGRELSRIRAFYLKKALQEGIYTTQDITEQNKIFWEEISTIG